MFRMYLFSNRHHFVSLYKMLNQEVILLLSVFDFHVYRRQDKSTTEKDAKKTIMIS